MEEGNLIGTKTGPYGEGGGSDPVWSGGRLAMLFRLGVGRAKSKFYDHSLCWRDVLFFKNVSKFHPPPLALLNKMKRAPNSLGESWCVLLDHAATQHSKMKIRLTMHARGIFFSRSADARGTEDFVGCMGRFARFS